MPVDSSNNVDFDERVKVAKKKFEDKVRKGYKGPLPRRWSKASVQAIKNALGGQQNK